MKNGKFSALVCSLLFSSAAYSQANTQLSNLVAPTKVNVSLLPDKDNQRDLGNLNKQWKDIYMRGIVWNGDKTFLGMYFSNTYIGQNAGNTLITGVHSDQSNTFVGSNSGFANTTGAFNTFLGSSAGQYNTNGGSNTFVGESAGKDNISGYNNTFLGIQAGTRNTTGNKNIMIGEVAGGFNKTGGNNVFIGSLAGFNNSASSFNTFVGDSAGTLATSGLNTMIGSKSGASSTTGVANTFVGNSSAIDNTTGSYNTAVGYLSLSENKTATRNTAIGYSTGSAYTNGAYNTFVGFDADASTGSLSNSSAFGNGSRITASNQVRIGNSSVTSIGGYAGWTTLPSDARVKKNIKANVPGLVFINKLKPLTYNLDLDAIDDIMQIKSANTDAQNEPQEDLASRKEKEAIVYTGFIAQDVQKAAQELNYDFSGVDAAKNGKDMYGIRYAEFVVPLVKAVQELSSQNEELKNQNKEQQKINNNLQKQIDELKALMISKSNEKVADNQTALK